MIEHSQPNTRAKPPWAHSCKDSSKQAVCCEQTVHPAKQTPNRHTGVCTRQYFHPRMEPSLSDSHHFWCLVEFDQTKLCLPVTDYKILSTLFWNERAGKGRGDKSKPKWIFKWTTRGTGTFIRPHCVCFKYRLQRVNEQRLFQCNLDDLQ